MRLATGTGSVFRFLFLAITAMHFSESWADDLPLEQYSRELLNPRPQGDRRQLSQDRRDALIRAFNKDPASVLKASFSRQIRDSVEPSARVYIEEQVPRVEGTLLVLEKFSLDGPEVIENKLLTSDGRVYSLILVHPFRRHPLTGSRILVKNAVRIPIQNASSVLAPSELEFLVAESAEEIGGAPQASAISPGTFGPQRAVVFLLNFQDDPLNRPWTKAQVQAEVLDKYNKYLVEASYNQATISGDIVDWNTIPVKSTDNCNSVTSAISRAASSVAHEARINLSEYSRRIYMFPKMSNCKWAGLSWIGTWNGDGQTPKGYGENWINGYNWLRVTGHELGHSYGLWHANAYNCGSTPISSSCTINTSADPVDLMGNRSHGHYNAYHKEQLGWLSFGSSPPIQTVTSSGTYTIDPMETGNSNPKALKILKGSNASGGKDYYYVEFRQPIGFDADIPATGNLFNGVMVHVGNDTNSKSSYLLNMTPSASGFLMAAISGNYIFQDPAAAGGGLSISLKSMTNTGAAVTVTFGETNPSCVRTNPSVTLSPSSQTVSPNSSVTYSVSIRNNDSAGCGSSTFSSTANASAPLQAALESGSGTIEPGKTATLVLKVTAPNNTSGNTYTLAVRTENIDASPYVGTSEASLVVQVPACVRGIPTVMLSPSSQIVLPGSSGTYHVIIQNKDSSGCGGSVFGSAMDVPSPLQYKWEPHNIWIEPEKTTASQITVTAPADTPHKSYPFSIRFGNINDWSLIGIGSGTLTVN